MNKLKRFVPGISNDVGVTMIQHDYGGYVEYISAADAIDALTTELSVAKKWGAELQRSLTDAKAAAIQHADRADQNERERIIAQDRLDRECVENAVFREKLAERDAEIERFKAAMVAAVNNAAFADGFATSAQIRVEKLTAENQRLREALHKIAWEPIGDAEATDSEIYRDILDIAKQALAATAQEQEKRK